VILPGVLSAGGLEVHVGHAGIRRLRCGGADLLSAQVAVRDSNWGTVPGITDAFEATPGTDGYLARWHVAHRDDDLQFEWDAQLDVRAAGPGSAELTFTVDGVARRDFMANRIGICVLHPLTMAGTTIGVRKHDRWLPVHLPAAISPDAPVSLFDGLRYELPGGGIAEITLAGDEFEMEDQRNWTDASLKTYCPPLARPFPRRFASGERLRQSLSVRVAGHRRRPPARAKPTEVRVGRRTGLSLPDIGSAVAPRDVPLSDQDKALVRTLGLRHVHAVVDSASPRWADDLEHGLRTAAALGCKLDLEIVVAAASEISGIASAIGADAAGLTGRIFLYDRASSVTTAALAAAWPAGRLGPAAGGSRANFAELNRASLPLARLCAVAFAVNPQVHASDDESVMSTVAVHGAVARQAVRLAGGRPVVVGPVTLRPRFNAVATGPPRRRPAGSLPDDVDPRQAGSFAAAWLLGSIAAIVPAGVSAATYFELAGARGLLSGSRGLPAGFPAPASVYPAYWILSLVAPLAGAPLLEASSDDPLVPVLALETPGGPLTLISNLRPTPAAVLLRAGWPEVIVHRLPGAPSASEISRASPAAPIRLGPYQTVAITTPEGSRDGS
jgi:D-apionolactonase